MSNLFGCSRVLAVGDIHGMYEKLIKLMEQLQFAPGDDLLIFLGDYIDRGPESVKCLQYVYDLQRQYPDSVVCLMGNHEVMLSSYFLQKKGIHTDLMKDFAASWLENGGLETLRQLKELEPGAREALVNWATDLPVQYRYQEFFFCHAGIDADMALDRQTDFDLLWKRHGWREFYKGADTIVVGHTPVQKLPDWTGRRAPKPQFLANHIILCDTGVYMNGGRLSCVDVLSRKVWQA